MSSLSNMRIIGWAVPGVCMILAGSMVFLQFQRVKTARDKQDQLAVETETLEKELVTLKARPKSALILAVDPSAGEEGEFVDMIKHLAGKNAVQIDRLRNNAVVLAANPRLPEMQPIDSEVELRGPYFGIRKFVTDLRTQSRVYVLQDAAWQNQKGESVLTLKVQRYVRKTKT